MKKFFGVSILAIALVMLFASVAYANFGPHGGYVTDTDACAGCHRAHTSVSAVTWRDNSSTPADHSALLVSNATKMSEFCYACHGDGAPGASTNVQSGVFDAGPSGPLGTAKGGTNDGVVVMYETNSTFDATLNGGGFDRMPNGPGVFKVSTSFHDMDQQGATDPMWGSGNTAPAGTNLTCTDCHDPHGSSNYRLLKDQIGSHQTGGYIDDDNATPMVISAEEGYPLSGWRKHVNGQIDMAAYRPNYTTPEYANYNQTFGADSASMSGWCSACHEQYDNKGNVFTGSAPYDYGTYESGLGANSGILMGARARHRHPVNVSLVMGDPSDPQHTLMAPIALSATTGVLPLEKTGAIDRSRPFEYTDYLGCLTCHRAHGSSSTMTGWAEASLDTTTNASAPVTWFPVLQPGSGGVNPNHSSALLRADNRGVCERCHNK